jgi:hypothetical protein
MRQSLWHNSMSFCCFEQTFLVLFLKFLLVSPSFSLLHHNFTYILFLISGCSFLVTIQYYHINFNYFFVMEQNV